MRMTIGDPRDHEDLREPILPSRRSVTQLACPRPEVELPAIVDFLKRIEYELWQGNPYGMFGFCLIEKELSIGDPLSLQGYGVRDAETGITHKEHERPESLFDAGIHVRMLVP